jgi:hypothetical protein
MPKAMHHMAANKIVRRYLYSIGANLSAFFVASNNPKPNLVNATQPFSSKALNIFISFSPCIHRAQAFSETALANMRRKNTQAYHLLLHPLCYHRNRI